MSVMSELHESIQEMLDEGREPAIIASLLDVPVTWVYEVSEQVAEEFDPFQTVNS